MTKGDIVYETTNLAEAGFSATVCLHEYDPAKTFPGEPAGTTKDAERNAAQAALETLRPLLEPLGVERKAKRAQKNAEQLAKLKEAHAAKKAAAKESALPGA